MSPASTLIIFGEPVEILVSGQMTSGRSTTLLQTSPPGGGPPPHMHRNEDETFFVLEGDYEFLANGAWIKAAPGQAVQGMRGSFHTFRNAGTAPGTDNGAISSKYFSNPAGATNISILPGDMDKILAISERFGISFQP